MGKVVGLLLIVVALAAGAVFVLTGAGVPRPGPLSEALGPWFVPWAGSPALAGGGAALLLLGVLLCARGGPERPFAFREALLLLSVVGAGAFTVAAVIGVGRGWSPETLAALMAGGLGQMVVTVGLLVRVATLPEKRKVLFVPAAAMTAVVFAAQLFVVTLGGA
ncbi:MAG: hypothetical protein KIT58_02455 [Planctomycetota bacterium]|nr:hypothetical protein [Planctomycetota bacterium]